MIYNHERPHNFDQIVGQEMVVENIRNQSLKDSFFNVFVLCGQYGSGKTTMARIIAMAANCRHKDGKGNPCGKCDSCRAVLEHSPEGIVEIDGASNNGVDNIRKLLGQASTLGVFDKKVFVIDEAHMLSKAAFNALLITLEDPPEHCIFILCTTEKDALPETVVSRAPVYTFGKIPDVLIKKHILEVAKKHAIAITADAAGLLSRYVNGAMRNALQLLEQLSLQKVEGEEITAQDIVSVLGLSSMEQRADFLRGCLNGDVCRVITVLRDCESNGISIKSFIQDVLKMNTDLLLCRSGAEVVGTAYYLEQVKALSAYPEGALIRANRMLSGIANQPVNMLSTESIVAEVVGIMREPVQAQEAPVISFMPGAVAKADEMSGQKKPDNTFAMQVEIPRVGKTEEPSVADTAKPVETVEVVRPEKQVEESDGFSDIPVDEEIPFEGSYVAETVQEEVPETAGNEEPEEISVPDMGFGFFGGFFGGMSAGMNVPAPSEQKTETIRIHDAYEAEADCDDIDSDEGYGPAVIGCVEPLEDIPFDSPIPEKTPVEEPYHDKEREENTAFADSIPMETEGRFSWDQAAENGFVPEKESLSLPVLESEEEIARHCLSEQDCVDEWEEEEEEEIPEKTLMPEKKEAAYTGEAKIELARLLEKPGFRIIFGKACVVENEGMIELRFKSQAHVVACKGLLKKEGAVHVVAVKE